MLYTCIRRGTLLGSDGYLKDPVPLDLTISAISLFTWILKMRLLAHSHVTININTIQIRGLFF